MVIVETPSFTRLVTGLLGDEEIRQLQVGLILRPEQGPVIRGGNGLRKLRWSIPGQGKRGSLRVFYYWDKPADRIYMLYVIEKASQADLTAAQLKQLARVIEEELT